jgi:hypothetical protein
LGQRGERWRGRVWARAKGEMVSATAQNRGEKEREGREEKKERGKSPLFSPLG